MILFIQLYSVHSSEAAVRRQAVFSLLRNHLTSLGKMARSWQACDAWALSTADIFCMGILSKKISVCLSVVGFICFVIVCFETDSHVSRAGLKVCM